MQPNKDQLFHVVDQIWQGDIFGDSPVAPCLDDGMDNHQSRRVLTRPSPRFFSQLTHDVRNPLNTIAMSSQLIERSALLTPDLQRAAERVQRASHELSTMIDRLVELNQVQIGLPLTPEPLALAALLHEVVSLLQRDDAPRLVGRSLQVVTDSDGDGAWDRAICLRLLRSLLAIALQYADANAEIRLLLETRGELLQLSLHATGDQLDPGLFDELLQDSVDDNRPGRVARGLAPLIFLTARLAALQAGQMSVHRSGQVTVFSILFTPAHV